MSLMWQLLTLVLFLSCCFVISQWCKARRQLVQEKKDRERFDLLWRHLPGIVTEIDQQGRILDVNQLVNGYQRDSIIGTLSTDHLSPEFAQLFQQKLSAAIQTLELQSYEISIPAADGSHKVLFNQLVPVIIDDQIQTLFVISSDITEQIRARDVMEQQRDRAEEANLAKSRFLASMSHEIRTPMNGLLGMVSLMEQTELDDEQQGFLRVIQSSSEHLLTIINDILDMSKIEANKLSIEEESFNVREMCDELLAMVSAKAKEKTLALQSFVESNIPENLIGDSVRIRQILMNYLTNAIKFTDTGHVLLRLVVVARQGSQVHLRFSVEDTGIGVEASKAMQLFDEYTFAHGRLSTLAGGSGLGLNICRRLAHLMNGKVGVVSTPDIGSNFWLDLRLTVGSEGDVKRMGPRINFAQQEIWVADEAQVNRALVAAVARELAAPVRELSSASELEHWLGQKRPSILVVSKRIFDGLAQQWSALALRSVKVAVTFPDTMTVDPQTLLERGVSACWDWPISQHNLAEVLKAMSGAQQVTQLITPLRTHVRSVEPQSMTLRNKHILLAEDNLVNQKVARQMLERIGCEVVVVNNGREAVETIQQQDFDLVLMDCHMPEMDGLEATEMMRHNGVSIPILALSADVMGEQKQVCLAAGMNDYLSKPIKLEELRQILSQYLASG